MKSASVSVSTVDVLSKDDPVGVEIVHPATAPSQATISISTPRLSFKLRKSPVLPSARFRSEKSGANPYKAAERGYITSVIKPSESRARIIESFLMLQNKRELRPQRKHGNIPM